MPIVQNILHVQGGSAQAAALFDFIADRRYGRGSVDLSRITPMPPWGLSSANQSGAPGEIRRRKLFPGLVPAELGSGSEYPAPTEKRQGVRWRNLRPLSNRGSGCKGADPQAVAGVQRPLSGLPVGQRRRGQPGGRGAVPGMAKR